MDQVETYNSTSDCLRYDCNAYVLDDTVNRDVSRKQHPEVLRALLPEISEFAHHNHFNVLHVILRYASQHMATLKISHEKFRLLAIGMELSEDTFVKQHGFAAVGETYGECSDGAQRVHVLSDISFA